MDFNEVFTLVVKYSSVRVAIPLRFDLELDQIDVKDMCLQCDLEEPASDETDERFVASGKKNMFCLLKKSLYELKQSTREWHKWFNTFRGL